MKLRKEEDRLFAEMALAWLLKEEVITSVLAGASKPSQILYNIKAVENTSFTQDEIETPF